MSPAENGPTASPSPPRKWRAYFAIILVVIVVYGADAYLKSSRTAGFLTPTATWRLEAEDLPGAWARWQQLAAYKALRDKAPGPLQAVPVRLRKQFGVRPTPARLQLWLGGPMLAGGGDGGWCIAVRPGLALRVASFFGAPGNGQPGEGYAHGWREGFFLIASTQEYLSRVLQDGEPVARRDLARDTLALSWDGEDAGALEVRVVDELPVRIEFPDKKDVAARSIGIAEWPDAAVALAFGGPEVPEMLARAGAGAAQLPLLAQGLAQWTPLATAWWEAYCPLELTPPASAPWALGLFEADGAAEFPAPELAFATRGPASEFSAVAGIATQAHRWNDTEGRLIPVSGDSRAWALAEQAGTLYLTSEERLMPLVLDSGAPPSAPQAARFHIRWEPFAKALLSLARRGAKEELLLDFNRDDVSEHIAPVLEGLQDWGSLELELEVNGGALQGSGHLARGDGAPG